MHPLAGACSAYGMGLADQIVMREAALEAPLDAAGLPAPAPRCRRAGRNATLPRQAQGRGPAELHRSRSCAALRRAPTPRCPCPLGTGPRSPPGAISRTPTGSAFAFLMPAGLVLEAVTVEAIGSPAAAGWRARPLPSRTAPPAPALHRAFDAAWAGAKSASLCASSCSPAP